jgi:hypothetical protein
VLPPSQGGQESAEASLGRQCRSGALLRPGYGKTAYSSRLHPAEGNPPLGKDVLLSRVLPLQDRVVATRWKGGPETADACLGGRRRGRALLNPCFSSGRVGTRLLVHLYAKRPRTRAEQSPAPTDDIGIKKGRFVNRPYRIFLNYNTFECLSA